MEEARNRQVLIDLVRVACAVLVICIHTRPWVDVNFYFGHYLSNVLARLAVPLFFLFSGYFLSLRLEREIRPERYLRRILLNLLRLYLVWCLIYFPYDWGRILAAEHAPLPAASLYLRYLLVEGGHFHLWYFPALIYALAILGFFYLRGRMAWLRILAVLLFLVGLAAEPYGSWVSRLAVSVQPLSLVEKLGTSRSALFFALPFLVWGFTLRKYLERVSSRALALGFAGGFFLLDVESFRLQSAWHAGGYNLYAFLPLAALCAFGLFLRNAPLHWRGDSRSLRDLSLLMYCLHAGPLLVLEDYAPHVYSNAQKFLLCLLSTLLLSLLVLRVPRLRKLLT
jgi:serine/alanine racemase